LHNAEIAVMGAKAFRNYLQKEINEAEDHEENLRKEAEYADLFANPYTLRNVVLLMR
jgi:propionyl-CoA carboxylase beta chain